MTKEQAPKTPRSIVRNHSPYSESTGPIVQEGFVAARVRALQGFSDKTKNATRSPYPLTPCPLHVYKSRNPTRPSFAFKPQEQHPFPGTTMPRRSTISDRRTGIPSATLFKDTVLPSATTICQGHLIAPSTTHDLSSKLKRDDVDDAPLASSLPSEKSILSPHAIKADLVEPLATWNCLSQTEDRNDDYIREQTSKPRGSIADKLGSMVERGWVGGDVFGKVYGDDDLVFDTTTSSFKISDTRVDSRTEPVEDIYQLKQVPSHSRSLSLSNPESRSESQHSEGQSTPPQVQQKKPKECMNQSPQEQGKREVKRNHAPNSPQRSSSDAGVQTDLAMRKGKRRAWTLHHFGRSESNHRGIQPEAYPTSWTNYDWDYHSSKQCHGSTGLPPSRENSVAQSGFDLSMPNGERLSHDSSALSKRNRSRRSSAHTKSSTRSGSRSPSFFKRFPWYKVALVDKQPVAYSVSKGGCRDNRISTATQAAYPDSNPKVIELSRGVSKSPTPIKCGDQEDDNRSDPTPAQPQGVIYQQAIDATASCYTSYSQPSLQPMISPLEMKEQEAPKQIYRMIEHPLGSHNASLKVGEERSRYPNQLTKYVVRQEHGSAGAGRLRTPPKASSQSGSVDASSQLAAAGDVLQVFSTEGPEVMEQSRIQSPKSSHATSSEKLLEKKSSGSETARPKEGLSARPSLYHGPRLDMASLTPQYLGNGTRSLPATVERSDQHGPTPREFQGGGKGIKKIQVTVTFDGAEDLVVEATLRKRDQHK